MLACYTIRSYIVQYLIWDLKVGQLKSVIPVGGMTPPASVLGSRSCEHYLLLTDVRFINGLYLGKHNLTLFHSAHFKYQGTTDKAGILMNIHMNKDFTLLVR